MNKQKSTMFTYFVIGMFIIAAFFPVITADTKENTTNSRDLVTLIDEGFEDGIPINWDNNGWILNFYGGPHSGSGWAYSWAAGDNLTPPIQTFGDNTELSFWYASETGEPMTLEIRIDSVVFWTETFTSTTYQQAIVDLSMYSGDHEVTFGGMTSGFTGQTLDDILLTSELDITPPTITNVDAQPPVQTTGGIVEITCDVTDNEGVDQVYANITYPDHSSDSYLMSGSGSYSYSQTYSQYGIYEYHIYAIDINTNTVESSIYTFEINNPPTADFSYSPSNPTTQDTIQFTDGSTDVDGTVVSWSWDFGNGASSTVQNPTHQFDDGTYTVTLTVTDDDGATDSFSKTINVDNIDPTAEFTYSPSDPTTADSVQFTDSSSDPDGTISSWSWDFGDGGTSTQSDPTYSYSDDGTYTITLTVVDDDGGIDSFSDTITVTNIGPTAEFTYSPSNPTTADSVQFTDLSVDADGTISSWSWDFGDGATSTLEDPTHQFDDGTYTVTLTVTDDDGATDTFSDSITVTNAPPTADFTYSPTDPTTQDVVSFTDQSDDFDGTIVSWSWDFGDGVTSTLENPTHQFDDGTYTVTLTVTDDDGATDSISDTLIVANIEPTASYTYSPNNPSTQDIVTFTDGSDDVDGTVVSWSWDFGDGASSTVQNPTHQFDDGTYTVTLTVTDDDGGTDSFSDTITVTNIDPTAEFTYSPSDPTTADSVQFTDSSSDPDGTISSWSWDFGDGGTSSQSNPTYSYSDDGTYTITLTVVDDDGGIDSFSDAITVTNIGPIADFTYDPLEPSVYDTVDFTDLSSDTDGSIVAWSWDFGDGNTSTEQNPSHNYPVSDEYVVSLTITDDDGATDTITETITVTPPVEIVDVNQSIFDRGFPIRHAEDGDWAGAQSFTPTTNLLTKVDVYLRKFGNPEFDLTVELRENSPEGTLIESIIFSPEQVPSDWEWITIDFQNFSVESETEYFIVCPPAPSGVTTSFGYEWAYAFGNQYDDGSFWFTRDGGDLWRDLPDMYEFTFRTYGY